jgi:hypothetical protein
MKWFSLYLSFSLIFVINGAVTFTARRTNSPKFVSMDETVVYRALTVIEGDILVDKFCECTMERECRNGGRSVIKLTK